MDGLAWPSEIPGGRGAAAQRNAKVGKDAAGLAGRYTSSSRQQEASRRNHKSAVVLHTGGGVYFRLPVLAYYTPRAKGGSKKAGAAHAGQVRSCQARHLGQQQLATAGPFERALSLSLPYPCFVPVWCASTFRGHRLLLSCYATAPLVYLWSPPIHEAGAGRELSTTTSAGSAPAPPPPSRPPRELGLVSLLRGGL